MNFIPGRKDGRDVLRGIRPEHLAVTAGGELAAEVIVVEPTGADTQIFCKVDGVDVTAVVRERHEFHPGEKIRLAPQLTYFFDPASGARLA
jgi:multiple sugar transport system ATP-binding protein